MRDFEENERCAVLLRRRETMSPMATIPPAGGLARLMTGITALRAEFCSGLLVRLWPGWMSQLIHISLRGTPTTPLQPETPLSGHLEKCQIHKCFI
jgi:hypothetical protein